MDKFRNMFSYMTLEKSMAKTLKRIDDSTLTNKDKEILAHSKYAFKAIKDNSLLSNIENSPSHEKSEVENNVVKLNQICANIKKADKRIKILEKKPTHTTDLNFQLKMKQSYIDDFLTCAEKLLKILKLHNRKPIVYDTLIDINKRYENFLNYAHKEMSSSISVSQSSKGIAYKQVIPGVNTESDCSITQTVSVHGSKEFKHPDVIRILENNKEKNISAKSNKGNSADKTNLISRIGPPPLIDIPDKKLPDKKDSLSSQRTSPDSLEIASDPKYCFALCDFDGDDYHVPMKEGDRIPIIEKDHTGIYTRNKKGQKTLVRSEFVEILHNSK